MREGRASVWFNTRANVYLSVVYSCLTLATHLKVEDWRPGNYIMVHPFDGTR